MVSIPAPITQNYHSNTLVNNNTYAALSKDLAQQALPQRRPHRKCLVAWPRSHRFGAAVSGDFEYSSNTRMRFVA